MAKKKMTVPHTPTPKGATTKDRVVYVKNSKGEIVKKIVKK